MTIGEDILDGGTGECMGVGGPSFITASQIPAVRACQVVGQGSNIMWKAEEPATAVV